MAGKIVTFGIKPDRAETGYGYLEVFDKLLRVCHQLLSLFESLLFSHQKRDTVNDRLEQLGWLGVMLDLIDVTLLKRVKCFESLLDNRHTL
ncbi:MAG: hypothetical protein COA99_14160 [Moraxellaceae bacterium]|nr:MAG: hypothetical protein COA99_14160 [Moraxellaceae bacterium]